MQSENLKRTTLRRIFSGLSRALNSLFGLGSGSGFAIRVRAEILSPIPTLVLPMLVDANID